MQNNLKALKKSSLFSGFNDTELESMLLCLNTSSREYRRGEYLLNAGDDIYKIGIIIYGSVQILRENESGEKEIVSEISSGGLFGETLCFAEIHTSHVSVLAVTDVVTLYIDKKKIVTTCPSSCTFHTKLIENMLHIIANKNIMLHDKINLLTKKTTREKLLAYFHMQAEKAGTDEFTIPFKREELADYLSVNRSAMSRELSKMQKDGLIHFNKNLFHL